MKNENSPLQTGYYSIGLTKDNTSRLWLQGSNLKSSNFNKGTAYSSTYDVNSQTIRLTVEEGGERTVSGRVNKSTGSVTPILELANADLLRVTQGAKKVRVDFYENEIVISIHHLAEKQIDRESRFNENKSNGSLVKAATCPITSMEFVLEKTKPSFNKSLTTIHETETTIFEATLSDIQAELIGKVDELSIYLSNEHAYEEFDSSLAFYGAIEIIRACNPAVICAVVSGNQSSDEMASHQLLKAFISTIGYSVTTTESSGFLAISETITHAEKISTAENFKATAVQNPCARPTKKQAADFSRDSNNKQIEREKNLLSSIAKKLLTKAVLCVGIGISAAATSDGLRAGGYPSEISYVIDRERKYLDIAYANNSVIKGSTRIIESSLEEIEGKDIDCVNELSFSLPCTSHSAAGITSNRLAFAEMHPTDALALIGALDVIKKSNAATIISENVIPARKSFTYKALKKMLTLMNYNISEINLSSEHTNSMENRARYWFVATSAGLPMVDFENHLPKFKRKYETLGELLEYIPEDDSKWKSSAEKIRKAAFNKANGKNFGFNIVDGTATKIGVCGKGYQKRRASEPHLAGREGFVRILTPKEVARAQSVPERLIANQVDNVIYEGLGQGIDYRQGVGVSFAVATSVYRKIGAI